MRNRVCKIEVMHLAGDALAAFECLVMVAGPARASTSALRQQQQAGQLAPLARTSAPALLPSFRAAAAGTSGQRSARGGHDALRHPTSAAFASAAGGSGAAQSSSGDTDCSLRAQVNGHDAQRHSITAMHANRTPAGTAVGHADASQQEHASGGAAGFCWKQQVKQPKPVGLQRPRNPLVRRRAKVRTSHFSKLVQYCVQHGWRPFCASHNGLARCSQELEELCRLCSRLPFQQHEVQLDLCDGCVAYRDLRTPQSPVYQLQALATSLLAAKSRSKRTAICERRRAKASLACMPA